MKLTRLPDAIAYRSEGAVEGLPLVLLHGFCESHSVWDVIMPSLSATRRVVRLDLPGFGASAPPAAASMGTYSEAIRAVLDEVSVEKCVLVGHSMGGYAALEFAEHHPERLSGLGLFHSHPFEDSDERREARRRGIEMLQAGKRDLYVSQLFPGLFAETFAKTHPERLNALIDEAKRFAPEGIAAALEAMLGRKNHTETLRRIACPVLFVLGEQDAIAPPEQVLQAAVLPRVADVHILTGVGHMGMFEAAEKSAEIVHKFWEFCAETI
ncbi:MAG: alpha/beta hydrolase [Saprospiraceae bacterium]|nr:alpha/beta hydrolase [Saprospiraceae bacterium]